jgi:crotonobetainyl-CoA:carnitine CoA-transferase CaiB-like acyl-CoA transferase
MFVRLAEVMEQPELAAADRYGPQASRLAARDEVNAIVARWVATLDLETALARCAEGGVPSSLIYSIADIFEDAQYRARGNIQMKESRAGTIAIPDVVPRLSSTPGEIRWLGEGIGAQNDEIFRDLLGLQDGDLKQMRDEGVI